MSNDKGESDVTPTESETTCTGGNFSHAVLLNRGERSQRYPFHPWKRIGRKRRDAITPTCTLLAESMGKTSDVGEILKAQSTMVTDAEVPSSLSQYVRFNSQHPR